MFAKRDKNQRFAPMMGQSVTKSSMCLPRAPAHGYAALSTRDFKEPYTMVSSHETTLLTFNASANNCKAEREILPPGPGAEASYAKTPSDTSG